MELFAINEVLRQLIARPCLNTNIVILVKTKSSLQAIINNNSCSTIIQSIRQNYKIVKNIIMQWIPPHMVLQGNEAADELAKKGTKII